MSKEHGITCDCRRCSDYWDKDHSEIKAEASPPSPPASEGPYRVEWDDSLLFHVRNTRTGELVPHSGSDRKFVAEEVRAIALVCHAAGKQEQSEVVRELVKAAKRAHASMIVGLLCEKGSPIETELRDALKAMGEHA